MRIIIKLFRFFPRFLPVCLGILIFEYAVTAPFSHSQTTKLKVIREIRIEGTKNFKERAVRELIRTRPKDFYSENALREDIQSILLYKVKIVIPKKEKYIFFLIYEVRLRRLRSAASFPMIPMVESKPRTESDSL